MMQFKITKQGVYLAVKGEQVEQEVGTVLKLEADEVPAFLAGKGYVIGDSEGKELVNNDELLNETIAENEALVKQVADLKAELKKADEFAAKDKKEIETLTAEVAALKKKAAN